jgi:hypothetical protein
MTPTTMTTKMMTKPTSLSMNNTSASSASRRRFAAAPQLVPNDTVPCEYDGISVSNIFVRCCLIESQSSIVPPTFASHGAARSARCCHQYRQHYCAARVEDVVHRHQACNCRCDQGRAAVREELDGRREVHRHRLDEVGVGGRRRVCWRSD